MPHREKELTPAQSALLSFLSPLDAPELFRHLHTTLSLSVTGFAERDESPTSKALEAWYFTLELLLHIHDITAESRA